MLLSNINLQNILINIQHMFVQVCLYDHYQLCVKNHYRCWRRGCWRPELLL